MHSYLEDSIDFSLIHHVLIIKLQHLGDVLITTPVFSSLKKNHPHLKIDALVYAETQPMLSENNDINHIHVIDRNWKQHKSELIRQEYSLFKKLQASQYQLIINYSDRWRGAWLTRLLHPKHSVSQSYPTRRGQWWKDSFTHIVKTTINDRHQVEVHLDALRRLGLYPKQSTKALQIFSGVRAEHEITQLLTDHNLQKQGYIVIQPTSRWMFKGWNRQGFQEVIKQLELSGYSIVITSGPAQSELNMVDQILQEEEFNIVNLAGKLSLKQLIALINHASCFLGLDSVAMHIAAAVQTPCVALFGPSNDKNWHPWQVDHRIIYEQVSCRPCNLDGCGGGKISDCLQNISPDRVVQAMTELLNTANN